MGHYKTDRSHEPRLSACGTFFSRSGEYLFCNAAVGCDSPHVAMFQPLVDLTLFSKGSTERVQVCGNRPVLIASVGLIVLAAGVKAGQNKDPDANPFRSGSTTEEIPTPTGTPQPQAAQDLLPGSNQLPAAPPILGPLQPPAPSSAGANATTDLRPIRQLSPEEQARNKARLTEIMGIAMHNSRAVVLHKEADGALTDEAKREFMRAYYHTLCTRMRDLDPGLGDTIAEFERAEIRKLALGASHLPVLADLPPHKKHIRPQRSSD
jgi:hypothetical protein